MNPRISVLAACMALFLLCSCAGDFDLSGPGTVYLDEEVKSSDVQRMVQPKNHPMRPLTALMLPLRVDQKMRDRSYLGMELSRIVWQSMLEVQAFPALSFAEDSALRNDFAAAQSVAISQGADLIIGGEITHILDGGTAGQTQVSMRIRVYDATTGTLIWSLAQAGQIIPGQTRDFVFYRLKSRLPLSPVQTVVGSMAQSMGEIIRDWNMPQPKDDAKESPKPAL
ncbi:hypothetical protein [Desulfobaculum bizertense]|uniref:Lipoprotein n=1 Tax=Desulfobaculum bizertense DSM 18034 TaxID=1121442 RepID=A0A1T4VXJ0_9BACT|nr:hypothetical protein [Desulfobaculum bizertense]UIJ36765.1 hypothetical protein LWC08_08430 [Desulfobaculum bizertense]SKA69211.1 hypothetical protein SAMN02745702_01065 [Desulfobaculum bizertense DSM 18034]